MLASFDLETRGLWGGIFRGGFYSKESGYISFYNAEEFIDIIYKLEENLPNITIKVGKKEKIVKDTLYLYGFNLEFDFSKIITEMVKNLTPLAIDWDNTLIIMGNIIRSKIMTKNIVFCDLFPIVQSSLEKASKSFELPTQKMEILGNKNEYFKMVDPDDENLLKYLKSDVLATYELLEKIRDLAQLSEQEFVRCPTVASLSMRIFKKNFQESFEIIKESGATKEIEEFIRKGYYGGRVEVYKNIITNGYHYDVNSLYPSEMENNYFPSGWCHFTKRPGDILTDGSIYDEKTLWIAKNALDALKHLYFIDCEVTVPEMNIPPLPVRHGGKLLFPVGTFSGIWSSVEIDYAISCGVKINKIFQICYWKKKTKVFKEFVATYRTLKESSTGAKRTFAKYIQNSLYGKFAMRRDRTVYINYCEYKRKKLTEAGHITAKVISVTGQEMLKYVKTLYADYIKPQYSVFITAYARITLLKMMHEVEAAGAKVYYCDTDCIVVDIPLPPENVCENTYGKWKLEREVAKGIYILPKLYAEVDPQEAETLKSKGIIREKQDTLQYSHYLDFYQKMTKYQDVTLYDGEYKGRRKILQVMVNNGKYDFDDIVDLKKRFRFSDQKIHKRAFDFKDNSSKPFDMDIIRAETEEEGQEMLVAYLYRHTTEYKKEFRRAIIKLGGVNDKDYEYIPRWCKRKKGLGLDELAISMGNHGYHYTGANALYDALLNH